VKRLLDLSYKGERNYLHGSDFFNSMSDLAGVLTGEPGYIEKLVFRKFAVHACAISNDSDVDDSTVIGSLRFKSLVSQTHSDWQIIETAQEVTGRYAFDEDELVTQAEINIQARSAVLPQPTRFTPIEEVIALTKRLNYEISAPRHGKWVFGQLDMKRPLLRPYDRLELHMRNLIQDRFSVNDIILNGEHVGTIRFIVGTP